MSLEYYLGVDGGATKTTFALANKQGKIIKTIKKGPSNPVDLGIDSVKSILLDGVTEILGDIPFDKVSVFMGLSGGISGDNKRLIGEFLSELGFAKFANGSDIENILSASLAGNDGIAVIMGTGSTAIVKRGEETFRLDGLGYLFSHGGCGYDIGNMGISAALKNEDGTGKPTIIRDLILEKTGKKTVLEDLGYFYQIGKSGIASFSTVVTEALKRGDEVAKEIIEYNMAHVANLIVTGGKMFSQDKVVVYLVGGLTNEIDILLPYVLKNLNNGERYDIKVFDGDVVVGALKLAVLKGSN